MNEHSHQNNDPEGISAEVLSAEEPSTSNQLSEHQQIGNNQAIDEPIGEVLKGLRHDHKLTLEELSNRLYEIGYPIEPSTLGRYETGTRRFSAGFIPVIARALGLNGEAEAAFFSAFITHIALTVADEYLEGKEQLEKRLGRTAEERR